VDKNGHLQGQSTKEIEEIKVENKIADRRNSRKYKCADEYE
jgi:hypothetical protein